MLLLLNRSQWLNYKALLANLIFLGLIIIVKITISILKKGIILVTWLLISNYLLALKVFNIYFLLL